MSEWIVMQESGAVMLPRSSVRLSNIFKLYGVASPPSGFSLPRRDVGLRVRWLAISSSICNSVFCSTPARANKSNPILPVSCSDIHEVQ